MRPSDLAPALLALLRAGRPAYIHGPPGVGKSDIVRQVAAAAGYALIDVRAVLLDPVDLRGLPWVDRGEADAEPVARWAAPGFLPRSKGPGVLFLDELAQAPQSVQNACLQLTLDRALGEYRLPDGWQVVAAGNRATDRAGASRLTTALASRFVHLDLDVSADDWQAWARVAMLHPMVRSFIGYRPSLLHDFDPTSNPERFPSPRGWRFVSELHTELASAGQLGSAIELDLIAGAVGLGAAAEFCAFSRLVLPDLDAIMAGSGTVPTDPPVLFALAGALGARCRTAQPAALDCVVGYLDRLPAEFAVLTLRDAIAARPDLLTRPATARWVQAHAGLLGF